MAHRPQSTENLYERNLWTPFYEKNVSSSWFLLSGHKDLCVEKKHYFNLCQQTYFGSFSLCYLIQLTPDETHQPDISSAKTIAMRF